MPAAQPSVASASPPPASASLGTVTPAFKDTNTAMTIPVSPGVTALVNKYRVARKAAWVAIHAAAKDEDDKALDSAASRAVRREEATMRRALQEPALLIGDVIEKFQIVADVAADGFAASDLIGPLDTELRRLIGKPGRADRGPDR